MDDNYTIYYCDLNVTYTTGVHAVRGVSFGVRQQECLALVGESGCGKTTMAHAALGLLPANAHLTGSIIIDDIDVIKASAREMRKLRGLVAGFVVQDPYAASNPLARVEAHVAEAWRAHGMDVPDQAVVQAVAKLGIHDPDTMVRRYPHQWSGGMLQRATIAAASAHNPKLIIADEPTSALDADRADTTIEALKQTGASLLLVSHDLSVVSQHADRIAICYAGEVVELGSGQSILQEHRHPYTAGLLKAIPGLTNKNLPQPIPGHPPNLRFEISGCAFAPRCPHKMDICLERSPRLENGVACHLYSGQQSARKETPQKAEKARPIRVLTQATSAQAKVFAEVRGVSKIYRQGARITHAVRSASLKVRQGEIVGISGPSGCGKSTLLRLLATIEVPDSGEVYLGGELAIRAGSKKVHSQLSRTAFLMPVFQDPIGSLDARWPIWRAIVEPLTAPHRKERLSKEQSRQIAHDLLKQVGLETVNIEARPAELSVGQCQRVAIARVLAARPSIIIADEPTSALDASASASVLHLLAEFIEQERAIVVVSHDRPMLNVLCDRVLEMRDGILNGED